MSNPFRRLALLVPAVLLPLAGCVATAHVSTYVDPDFGSRPVRSVAVLPLENGRLGPQIAANINGGILQGIGRRNPSLVLVGPRDAQERISDGGLIEAYAQFLRDYATSGLINRTTLSKVGAALRVDAVLQGEITQLVAEDGYPYHGAHTNITIRYSLIGTATGTLLWQCSGSGEKMVSAMQKAPPLEEVIPAALDAILKALPPLG